MKKWFGSEREEKLWKIIGPTLTVVPAFVVSFLLIDHFLPALLAVIAYHVLSTVFDFPGVINLILWAVGLVLLILWEPWPVILIYVLLFLYLLARAVLLSGRKL